ncbi:MAG: hypothetical protein K1X66_02395 [Verrucomicrobiae bacterium]|nr:hypothetical protein [Verrucomicrobiae bacterium]
MKAFIARLIRHGLTVLCGWFMAHGVIDQAGALKITDGSEVLAGIACGLFALLLSYLKDKGIFNFFKTK